MKLAHLVRFGLIALALLLTVLFVGPAAGVRAQEGEPVANDPAASQPQAPAEVLGTAFTYQGRLNDGANPANGAYDFQFSLWDELGSGSPPSGGNQIGATLPKDDWPVSGGSFTADLDFGAGAFAGQARWLQVAVRPGASTGAYTTLAPRRALLASPYATYSNNTRGMIVTSDGRVGFGVNPEQRFTFQGNSSQGNGLLVIGNAVDSRTAEFRFPGTTPVGLMRAGIRISGGVDGVNHADFAIYRGDALIDNGIAGGNILLYTKEEQGRVGINTTEPAATLEVHNGALLVSGTAFQGQNVPARLVVDTGGSTGHALLELRNANGTMVRVTGNGTTSTKILKIEGGADLAEPFAISGTNKPEPGLVVAIDPDHIGQLRVADKAYDRTVAGVISGAGGLQPGLVMQQPEVVQGETHPVALTGRVYVWADASFGAIQPGDLLTTSATPGHAMRVGDYAQAQGAILGKAMSRLEEGRGLVLVLVSLQ